MANLVELSQNYKNLLELVHNEDIDPVMLEQALQGAEGELTDKLESVTYILREMDSDSEAMDREIERLKNRKQVLNNKYNRLKDYMLMCMKVAGTTQIKTPLNTWSIRKTPPSLIIEDEDSIPTEFKSEVVKVQVDKKALKQAIKEGLELEGVRLESKESINIK